MRETEVELLKHEPYAEIVNDSIRRDQITGRVNDPMLATFIAEGYVCARTKMPRTTMVIPDYVKDGLLTLGLPVSRERTEGVHVSEDATIRMSSTQNSGVKRKHQDESINALLNNETSESEDEFMDSQQFETQPRSNRLHSGT